MKYCSKCGGPNADESMFCASCGTPLEEAPKAQEPVIQEPQQPVQPEIAPSQSYAAPDESAPQAPQQPAYAAPQPPYAAPREPNKATMWLILNIVLFVFCCPSFIFSILGIIFSAIGMGAYDRGEYDEMKKHSRTAMIMFIIGVAVGILVIAATFVGVIVSMRNLNLDWSDFINRYMTFGE